jgi:hypothetical protein
MVEMTIVDLESNAAAFGEVPGAFICQEIKSGEYKKWYMIVLNTIIMINFL